MFTSVISFDKDSYIKTTEMTTEQVDLLNNIFKEHNLKPTVYDYILTNKTITNQLLLSLDFFFVEHVAFNPNNGTFFTYTDSEKPEESKVGVISRDNFKDVFAVILQRCNLYNDEDEDYDSMVFRNEATRRKWIKQHEGELARRRQKQKTNSAKFELPNIISSVCAEGIGITMLNVWDMTVYNLYDQFQRVRNNRIDRMTTTHISVWGDKKGSYDTDGWLTNNVTKNSN